MEKTVELKKPDFYFMYLWKNAKEHSTEQINSSIFIPTPVLGRNEKLINCHIKLKAE